MPADLRTSWGVLHLVSAAWLACLSTDLRLVGYEEAIFVSCLNKFRSVGARIAVVSNLLILRGIDRLFHRNRVVSLKENRIKVIECGKLSTFAVVCS